MPPSLPPNPGRIPVIVGPTAGGKSALALQLAHKIGNAELITADAFQIYKGMDIGTAKPTVAERQGIPHHLLDLRDPRDPTPFTVHDWLRAANASIADIRARGKTPIVVGGTHLYAKALLDGLFDGPGADPALRERLRAEGLPALREELERVDPQAAQRIHANDERRTIRALEVFHLTGKPISAHQTQWDSGASSTPGHLDTSTPRFLLIGLDWPSEKINPRINQRVKHMMESGFLEEVRALHASGAFGPTANPQAREALGYKQLLDHLEGRRSLEDAVERIKIDTRHFAKTQRTWLKRLRPTSGSIWIDAASTLAEEWVDIVLKARIEHTPRSPRIHDHATIGKEAPQIQRVPARGLSEPDTRFGRDRGPGLPRSFLWIAAGSILFGLLGFPLLMLGHGVFSGLAFGLSALGILAFVVGAGFVLLREARSQPGLKGLGFNACPKCGYHLDGLRDSGACPECGGVYTRVSLSGLRKSTTKRDSSST